MRRVTAAVLASTLLAGPAAAGDGLELPDWVEKTKLSLVAFGDAYFMAENHDDEIEGANGFWFRRIDLTIDTELNESFSTRLRLEMESKGDFETATKMEPFVKNASLRWKTGPNELEFGLVETPNWKVVEKTWGYRAVEKTPLDLQKLGNSRDLGISFQGKAADGKVVYKAMYGNGSDKNNEINEDKKVYGSVQFYPTENWVAELYADYDARPENADRQTIQGFLAYKADRGRLGVQYAYHTRNVDGGDDYELDVLSVFGVVDLNDRFSLLARHDRLSEPNPDGDKISYLPFASSGASRLFIFGLDCRVTDNIQLIPNLEYVTYDADEDEPSDDLMGRLTVAWKF